MQPLSDDQIERVLEWYQKDPGEALVGEELLAGVDAGMLRELLDADPDADPDVLDTYEVEPHEVEALQPHVEHRIDLDAYDYFVAAYRRSAR